MKEKNNDQQLHELFSEKLDGQTVSAPDFVWTNIEKELFPPAKKRRPFFWWFLFTGLFLGTLSYFLFAPRALFPLSINYPKSYTSQFQKIKNLDSAKNAQPINDQGLTQIVDTKVENKLNLSENSSANHFNSKKKTVKIKRNRVQKNKSPKPDLDAISLNNQLTNPDYISLKSDSASQKQVTEDQANFLDSINKDFYNLEFTRLIAKSLDQNREAIPSKKYEYTFPKAFVPFSFLDFHLGFGRNNRDYSVNLEKQINKQAVFVDRTIPLKNRSFGFDYNYQARSFFSLRVGVSMGSNRYTTRLFPIRIANTSLNDEIDISSPNGEIKSAPLNLEDQASTTSDSTTFLMRIIHRSSYVSIPLSVRFNSTNIYGPQFYGYTGVNLQFKGSDRNTLIIRQSLLNRSFSTSKTRDARTFYPEWHIGLGLASNPIRSVQFYGEFNFSQVVGAYYKSESVTIKSRYSQLNIGLRFKL